MTMLDRSRLGLLLSRVGVTLVALLRMLVVACCVSHYEPLARDAIVYTSYSRDGAWIVRTNLDGRHRTRLAHGELPQVSPDGRWVAFYRRVLKTGWQLWVMPLTGGRSMLIREGALMIGRWLP